jgi:aminoglycoside 3-N-acetyltransferase
MPSDISLASLSDDLAAIGLQTGDRVIVHSSFRSLGVTDPEAIIQALVQAVGDEGTLLMPALSYKQQPPLVHDTRNTPSCVGFLPEYFRRRAGTKRSLHPTHSVCALGANVSSLLDEHILDSTPCGEHSPFHKLLQCGGKILMLGCGLRPNTTMHAIEEYVRPPYLFGQPVTYTITDQSGHTFTRQYTPHGFKGYSQRYDRVAGILGRQHLRRGAVGKADSFLIDSTALLAEALQRLRADPYYLVDAPPEEPPSA